MITVHHWNMLWYWKLFQGQTQRDGGQQSLRCRCGYFQYVKHAGTRGSRGMPPFLPRKNFKIDAKIL